MLSVLSDEECFPFKECDVRDDAICTVCTSMTPQIPISVPVTERQWARSVLGDFLYLKVSYEALIEPTLARARGPLRSYGAQAQ